MEVADVRKKSAVRRFDGRGQSRQVRIHGLRVVHHHTLCADEKPVTLKPNKGVVSWKNL
jgi:hypothetical protein